MWTKPEGGAWMLPCLLCDAVFAHADTVIKHIRTRHSPTVQYSADVYGRMCPLCGKSFERLDQHCSRTHRQPVAQAFAVAARLGDPTGAVRARVSLLLDQELVDLEARMDRLLSYGVGG